MYDQRSARERLIVTVYALEPGISEPAATCWLVEDNGKDPLLHDPVDAELHKTVTADTGMVGQPLTEVPLA